MSRKSIEARDNLIKANAALMCIVTSHLDAHGELGKFTSEEVAEIFRLRNIINQYLPKEGD